MDKLKKRFIAIFMAMAMTLCFTISAFAAEPVDVISPASTISTEEASTRASVGKVIGFNAQTIQGPLASINVTLSSMNFNADFVAQIGYTSENSPIICHVITPSGEDIYLGTISGSGSSTPPYEMFYAKAGTYKFTFQTTITSPIEVAAYIYD